MSATPRPWAISPHHDCAIVSSPETAYVSVQGPVLLVTCTTSDDTRLILRAVNAFDALLAVAKAVDARVAALNPGHEWHGWQWNALEEAVMALNNEHPGWREWTP